MREIKPNIMFRLYRLLLLPGATGSLVEAFKMTSERDKRQKGVGLYV